MYTWMYIHISAHTHTHTYVYIFIHTNKYIELDKKKIIIIDTDI